MSTFLLIGLGNPGPRYAGNRHNVGFMVIDELARRAAAKFNTHKSVAELASVRIGPLPGQSAILMKSKSFMNTTGSPVAAVTHYYDIVPEHIIVVHDELDIDFAAIRIKLGGGDNGHNGLRSITSAIGSKEYYRIRVGIGRPPGRQNPADFVLKDFSATERKELPLLICDSADAVESLIQQGMVATQQFYHSR